MAQVDTVVPNSINYTDIKPQAIENKIQLIRYQPTINIAGAKGGDMIKFLLSGNGFLDPYSTYFQFTVECPDLKPNECRFLDRSAHSFINRMVIRSQGVELERIDNYDVVAAMINDMIYSPEQCTQHYWEGFPTHQFQPNESIQQNSLSWVMGKIYAQRSHAVVNDEKVFKSLDGVLFRPSKTPARDILFRMLCQGANPTEFSYIGETCFHQLGPQRNYSQTQSGHLLAVNDDGDESVDDDQEDRVITHIQEWNMDTLETGQGLESGFIDAAEKPHYSDQWPIDYEFMVDHTYAQELLNGAQVPDFDPRTMGSARNNALYPITWSFHRGGRRVPSGVPVLIDSGDGDDDNSYDRFSPSHIQPHGTSKMTFIIPVYSGILGLLMPEKKLLPLNLLPLDIEIIFNPHALYSTHSTGSRNYRVLDFYLFGNTLFFEQEIHKTLEASVADHGLFLYCNSFHSAPVQQLATRQVPTNMYISMNLKSINSVHWTFLYSHFETKPCARKLHFVSHNLRKVQLLNGTQLIPQYPIEGQMGTSQDGSQLPFTIELYKAWNKMHDPARDGALHAYNTCGDEYAGQFDPIYIDGGAEVPLQAMQNHPIFMKSTGPAWGVFGEPGQPKRLPSTVEGMSFRNTPDSLHTLKQIANKQASVGRSQYGISLEGEELGSDHTMITGRKSQYPFMLQMYSDEKFSSAVSYMLTFLRADFIVYIRPDLQIVTLGK